MTKEEKIKELRSKIQALKDETDQKIKQLQIILLKKEEGKNYE